MTTLPERAGRFAASTLKVLGRLRYAAFALASLACASGCGGGGTAVVTPPSADASGASASATSSTKPSALPSGAAGAPTAPAATPSPAASGTASSASTAMPVATSSATPTATPAPLAGLLTTAATSADAFVSTMGVDVDLVATPAAEQSAIATAFAGLGVRQTRIAVLEPNGTYQTVVKAFFAANPNVSAFGLTDCAQPLGASSSSGVSAANVGAFIQATGARLDYIEGVNEPDDRGDTTWPVDTRTCIAPFVNGVAGVPFLAPSLVTKLSGTDEMELGSLSGQVAATNVHRYFGGYNPGTSGYGSSDSCGTYGGISWSICWGEYSDSSVPVIVTETGWNSQTEVDELTQAKYVERVFFVNAEAGIAKTSLYTLLSYTGDAFGGDGLLRADLTKKPAYTAVGNITKLLADPGASYTPAALPLLVTPTASTSGGGGLRMMLIGKRDGSYQVALWQEIVSAIPGSYGTDSAPQAISATVGVGGVFAGTIDAWQNDGTVTQTPAGSGVLFAVPVSDRLTILNLAPMK